MKENENSCRTAEKKNENSREAAEKKEPSEQNTPPAGEIKERKSRGGGRLSAADLALIGMLVATLEAGKLVLASMPNIEIVSLLIILYTLQFGKKTIAGVAVFVLLECAVWGIGLWTIMYLYLWPLLSVVTYCLRGIDSRWFWSIFSAVFGVMYGALCALVYLFFGGPQTAFAWWIAGIPWDILHGAANFVLMLVLYTPLRSVFRRLSAQRNVQ